MAMTTPLFHGNLSEDNDYRLVVSQSEYSFYRHYTGSMIATFFTGTSRMHRDKDCVASRPHVRHPYLDEFEAICATTVGCANTIASSTVNYIDPDLVSAAKAKLALALVAMRELHDRIEEEIGSKPGELQHYSIISRELFKD